MGSFALAGAVKGLGEGMVKRSEYQQDEHMLEKSSSLAEARDKRIAALNNKYRKEEATTQNQRTVDAAALLEKNKSAQYDTEVIDRQLDASIAQGYELAQIEARGENQRAAAVAANAPTQKYTDRFEVGPQSVGEDGYTINNTIYDSRTGDLFTSQGDKRVLDGSEALVPQREDFALDEEFFFANKIHNQKLQILENMNANDPKFEATRREFLNKYQYLPTSIWPKMERENLSGSQ